MKTKGQDRKETTFFFYLVVIIAYLSLYVTDKITGSDSFLGILGFGIVCVLFSTMEFDTDDEGSPI